MPERAVTKGATRGRASGRGEKAARGPVGERTARRPVRAGRPSEPGSGGIGNRAMGRLFDREAGGGERLDAGLRRQMESSFGADFSGVRLIRGSRAARGLGAEAVTRGERVHLAPGRYAPGTTNGKALIGHELAHVVQQRRGVRVTAQAKGVGINQDRGLEAEADRAGDRAARGLKAGIVGGGGRIGGPPVAQCKVGMEYQATNEGGIGVKKKDGFKWVDPGHGEVISVHAGFKVETDTNELEYVTSAVDERSDDAVLGLVTAAGAAAAIHKKITDTKNLTRDDLNVTAFVDGDGFYEVTATSGTVYRLYKAGKKNAHPQATVGIRLDRIGNLMAEMGKSMDDTSDDWKKVGYGRKTVDHRTAEQKMLRDTVTTVRAQMLAIEDAFKEHGFTLDKSLEGFLAMLVAYVGGTRVLGKANTANAKNAYALMGRTSLWSMFKALAQRERETAWYILTNGHDLYANAREALFGSKATGLVTVGSEARKGGGVNKTSLYDVVKKFQANEPEPFSDYHAVSALDESATEWEADKAKYGISRPTDIGYDTDDTVVQGAVLEMRALGRNVAPDKWAEVAGAVAAIVKATNADE